MVGPFSPFVSHTSVPVLLDVLVPLEALVLVPLEELVLVPLEELVLVPLEELVLVPLEELVPELPWPWDVLVPLEELVPELPWPCDVLVPLDELVPLEELELVWWPQLVPCGSPGSAPGTCDASGHKMSCGLGFDAATAAIDVDGAL